LSLLGLSFAVLMAYDDSYHWVKW